MTDNTNTGIPPSQTKIVVEYLHTIKKILDRYPHHFDITIEDASTEDSTDDITKTTVIWSFGNKPVGVELKFNINDNTDLVLAWKEFNTSGETIGVSALERPTPQEVVQKLLATQT